MGDAFSAILVETPSRATLINMSNIFGTLSVSSESESAVSEDNTTVDDDSSVTERHAVASVASSGTTFDNILARSAADLTFLGENINGSFDQQPVAEGDSSSSVSSLTGVSHTAASRSHVDLQALMGALDQVLRETQIRNQMSLNIRSLADQMYPEQNLDNTGSNGQNYEIQITRNISDIVWHSVDHILNDFLAELRFMSGNEFATVVSRIRNPPTARASTGDIVHQPGVEHVNGSRLDAGSSDSVDQGEDDSDVQDSKPSAKRKR
jgi:hypothetical protein